MNRDLSLRTPYGTLHGRLEFPAGAHGLVLLAHLRPTPAGDFLAGGLGALGYAVASMELLCARETQFADAAQNVPRLTERLLQVLDLARADGDMAALPLAIFATGEATPAAIRAAARRDSQVRALACHGGIVDRAGLQALDLLAAPLLMLFDADDSTGQAAWRRAQGHIRCPTGTQLLETAEDPVPHIAAWFAAQLKT